MLSINQLLFEKLTKLTKLKIFSLSIIKKTPYHKKINMLEIINTEAVHTNKSCFQFNLDT